MSINLKNLMKKYFRNKQEDETFLNTYMTNHYYYINGTYYDNIHINTITQNITNTTIQGNTIKITTDKNIHNNQKILIGLETTTKTKNNNNITITYKKTNINKTIELTLTHTLIAYNNTELCNANLKIVNNKENKAYNHYSGFTVPLQNQYIYTEESDNEILLKCDNLISGQEFIVTMKDNSTATGTIDTGTNGNLIARINKNLIKSVELTSIKNNNNIYLGAYYIL